MKNGIKTIFIVCLGLITTVALLAGCAAPATTPAPAPKPAPAPATTAAPAPKPSPSPAPGPATVWTFAIHRGTNSMELAYTPNPRFQDMIAKATGGRLKLDTKVEIFPPNEVINAVIDGRIDMGLQRLDYVSGTFPLWGFGSLPFFFSNYHYEYEAALNDPRMIQLLQKSYGESGLFYLFDTSGTGIESIWSKKPIATLDDLKGVKVRASGLLTTRALQLLGAAPLTTAPGEIVDAMQKGLVDAVASGMGFGLFLGLADVSKYVNSWPITEVFPGSVVVNMKKWNALPDDLKQIVINVAKEVQGQVVLAVDVEWRKTLASLQAAKMQVIIPDKAHIQKARELTKPAIDEWVKLAGPYAPELLSIASQYASGAKK
ncbi:MAG: TRAP transporter substrate-binding protein DctP [Chloroflexi bacterium]|nr:TRAP transporter substrate-binding protein DctP [Chloroflexota bacterium]